MSETIKNPKFTAGNFYKYEPSTTWCRDGFAEANAHGLQDTYWGATASDYLSQKEAATAVLFIDLAEFEEIDRYTRHTPHRWEERHPDDRKKIPAQHGCCTRWFIRKGSQPDLGTKISNAEKALKEAEEKLASAQRSVEWRREELAKLKANAPTTEETV